MHTISAASIVVVLSLFASACTQGEAVITVDPTERFQVMRGWEVTTDMEDEEHPESIPFYRDTVYDMAVSEVGIDRVRLEVRSGAENTNRAWEKFSSGQIKYQDWRPMRYPTVNDNDDPNSINWSGFDFSELDTSVDTIVLPLNQRIEARGERLFINLCYVAFTDQIKEGKYEHDNPEEYAEFVLATYLHLKEKYGLVPDVWEVLLEPDNGQKQWNANLMGRAIVAASAKLKANGFTPAFVAPSTKDMANAAPWIEEIAKVPSAMENVAEFSYHRYRSSSAANARAIGKIGERFGKPTGMLEWWFKNGTYKVLREDLVQARNSSWQGQVIRTLFDIDFANPRAPVVTIASDTRMNLQYFRYIRLGAQRIGASSTDPRNTRPTAFVNSDGRMIVVADTKGAVTLTIRGARSGKYRVSYALDDRSVVDPEVVTPLANGDVVVRMPGRGVITVSPADA
jgi:hypothetical protein